MAVPGRPPAPGRPPGGAGGPPPGPVLGRPTLWYSPPDGPPGTTGVTVTVRDARATPPGGWRDCGFELREAPSDVADWDDDEQVAALAYAEAERLVAGLTGADAVLVSDHVRRRAAGASGRTQAPVHLVHSDFAPGYERVVAANYRSVRRRGAAALARAEIGPADVARARRLAVLQLWRNLGPRRPDLPVAFCDARTVQPSEVRPAPYTGYVAGGRGFDFLAVIAPGDPDRHQWWSHPDMGPGEVVVFRTYDTEAVAAGRTWFTPHSAWRDPAGTGPRHSVEMRAVCLWF